MTRSASSSGVSSTSALPSLRRRGHPPALPATQIGRYIQERIAQAHLRMVDVYTSLGVSRATFMRWLRGTTLVTRSFSLEQLADALNLQTSEREEFLTACQARLNKGGIVNQPRSSSGETPPYSMAKRRVQTLRARRTASTPFGACLQALLADKTMSQAELARRLKVAPGTITLLIFGAQRKIHAFTAEQLADALELTDMKRREFLALAAGTGMFALSGAIEAPRLFVLHHPRFDLDDVERTFQAIILQHNRGNTCGIVAEYDMLRERIAHARLSFSDRRVVDLVYRLGAFEATLFETLVPWYQRSKVTIERYLQLEETLLNRFPINDFAYEHAYVAARIAPMYREQGDYERGLYTFTNAIEHLAPVSRDPSIRIELFQNRAHIYAVQGDEASWRRDIETARRYAQSLPSPAREEALGVIRYSEGEGMKRLASRQGNSPKQQQAYAQQGFDMLQESLHLVHSPWVAQDLLVAVSQGQCLIHLDPNEAVARLESVRARAAQVYPALVRKIDVSIRGAKRILRQKTSQK